MRGVSDSRTVVAVTPTRRVRRPRFDEDRDRRGEAQRQPSEPSADEALDDDPPPAGAHVDEFA